MKYSIDKSTEVVKFKLEEENLNSLIAPDLKSEFIILRNKGVRNLILLLSEVKYVDSMGLSSLLTANRLWKDYGHFIICEIKNDFVEKLIKISRLDNILMITDTVENAMELLKNNPIKPDISEEE